MKILVPFKRVPDPNSEGSDAAPWILNPFDEIALEEALKLKESGSASEVVGATIAGEEAEEQMRNAMAMGLDRALRVDDSRTLDPYSVSRILSSLVRRELPGLILMGKQSVDGDSNQTGQMLAGLLGWPQATFISKIEILDPARARCVRETDRGLETIEIKLPAVVTADLRLNEPRYVSLPGLMKARRRPIEVISLAELDTTAEPRTRVVSTRQAPKRAGGVKIGSVPELIAKLRDQDKVL